MNNSAMEPNNPIFKILHETDNRWQHRTDKQQRKSKQTNTRKERTKITKENSTGRKHKWKHAECDHVKKGRKKAAKQNPSSI
jgi:hypothetical protein